LEKTLQRVAHGVPLGDPRAGFESHRPGGIHHEVDVERDRNCLGGLSCAGVGAAIGRASVDVDAARGSVITASAAVGTGAAPVAAVRAATVQLRAAVLGTASRTDYQCGN